MGLTNTLLGLPCIQCVSKHSGYLKVFIGISSARAWLWVFQVSKGIFGYSDCLEHF